MTTSIEILYSNDADAALLAFEGVASEMERATVASAIAAFEASPSESRYRQRRYRDPPLFGFIIRTPTVDYVVLWKMDDEATGIVYYFGAAI